MQRTQPTNGRGWEAAHLLPNLAERPKILALDPGTRHTGYVLLRGEKLVTWGVWRLANGDASPHTETVADHVRSYLADFTPTEVVLEWPSPVPEHRRGKKVQTLRRLHRVAQTIAATCDELHIPTARYEPPMIRRIVLGNGWATKDEVAASLAILYPEMALTLKQDRRWKEIHWRHVFDALAAARCHLAVQKPEKTKRAPA